MVEYNDLAAAQHAKKVLQDQDIYSDCCTIKVEYARTQKLNVYKVKIIKIYYSLIWKCSIVEKIMKNIGN